MNSIARKTPRLGTPPGGPSPDNAGFDAPSTGDPAPSWHELVQPGPKADPTRVRHEPHAGVIVEQAGDGNNRAQRRATGGRGWNPGRLVNHRTRLHPIDGGERPDVERRRAHRIARAAA